MQRFVIQIAAGVSAKNCNVCGGGGGGGIAVVYKYYNVNIGVFAIKDKHVKPSESECLSRFYVTHKDES